MATKFLEPGGDTNFAVGLTNTTGFWGHVNSTPAVATDFVHGTHVKSIKYRAGFADGVAPADNTIADAGARISNYFYFVAFPNATEGFFYIDTPTGSTVVFMLRLTSGGVLSLYRSNGSLVASGSTLSTGVWYRISVAYTIASGASNEIRVYLDGVLDITATNTTLTTGARTFYIANVASNATLDFRSSDCYADDSTALTDTGNVWVTAKRPNANGAANEFTTQIGSGGSGYGSGHSPQVNERPWDSANGWSLTNTTIKTEEYTLESVSQGDIDITGATIIDFQGWITSSVNSTANSPVHKLILAGTSYAITEATSLQMFSQIAGSSTYPSTNTAIGVSGQYTTTGHLTRLFDCGIMVAFIPAIPSAIKTQLGLAVASVKTNNGLAVASRKTWDGLA